MAGMALDFVGLIVLELRVIGLLGVLIDFSGFISGLVRGGTSPAGPGSIPLVGIALKELGIGALMGVVLVGPVGSGVAGKVVGVGGSFTVLAAVGLVPLVGFARGAMCLGAGMVGIVLP